MAIGAAGVWSGVLIPGQGQALASPAPMRVDYSGQDLTGADLSGCDLWGANLLDANLLRAILTGATLIGATLTGAVRRPGISRADMDGVKGLDTVKGLID